MLILRIRRAVAPDGVLSAGFDEAFVDLPNGYEPILAPSLAMQANLLHIAVPTAKAIDEPASPFTSSRPYVLHAAEVLTDGTTVVTVLLRSDRPRNQMRQLSDGRLVRDETPAETMLWLFCMSREVEPDSFRKLEVELASRFGVTFSAHYYAAGTFSNLKDEGRESLEEPTPAETSAAAVLVDRATRTLAISIKSSGGLLVSDLAKQLPKNEQQRVAEIRASLEAQNIVAAEVVVVCKKTHAQTARLPSRDLLPELAAKGLRCACGRSVTEESIEEALTITEFGRTLLDGSRWFSVLLLTELLRVGVPIDRILLEHTDGGDELDCIADVSGEVVFFELKDKEFSLGNAYSFGAKIGILRPRHPVIVTSEYVGNDAKEHFQRAQMAGGGGNARRRAYPFNDPDAPEQVRYIEGIDALRPGVEELVSEIYTRDAVGILAEVLGQGFLSPAAVIGAVTTSTVI